MQGNPKDPLNDAADFQRELFERFAIAAGGFTTEHVVGAAANLIVNAIRQAYPTQRGAMASMEEITAQVRGLLAGHYDGMGKRRNIFPFHQVIEMPLFDARASLKNGKAN